MCESIYSTEAMRGELFDFINSPSETSYQNYVSSALADIEALSDLLGVVEESSGDLLESTRKRVPWMIQETLQNLKAIMAIWDKSQTSENMSPFHSAVK